MSRNGVTCHVHLSFVVSLIVNACVPFLVSQASDHDTKNFDPDFTMEVPKFTPTDKDLLQSMDQGQFRGFSFVNPYFGTQH